MATPLRLAMVTMGMVRRLATVTAAWPIMRTGEMLPVFPIMGLTEYSGHLP